MSCAATRQGDEMYCSRCQTRWPADEGQTVACLPEVKRKSVTVATSAGPFDARAFALARRGWVSNSGVLDRMEIIAREAYAAGVKAGRAA